MSHIVQPRVSRVATSADLTLTVKHHYVVVDTSGALRTITLPATDDATIGPGKVYIIKRKGANNVDIARNGSNLIDGAAATYSLTTDKATVWLISNGLAGASGDWELA